MTQADSIIERELHVLTLLIQLADDKRLALIHNDLDALRRVTESEEAAAKNLKQLEETRLKQAGLFTSIPSRDEEFRQRLYELKEKNDFNQTILGDALAYTRFMLQMLMGVGAKPAVYGAEGKIQEGTYRRIIDGRG